MKALKLLNGLLALTLLTAAIAAFGVEPATAALWATGLSVVGSIAMPANVLAVTSSSMITDFATAFGAYYHPRGQNAERLKKLLMYDDSPWNEQFTLTPLEGDTLEYALMSHDRVLQPFKPYWSPTGSLDGDPRRITLQRVKVNVAEIPDLLVNTWAGFLTTEGGKDPNVNRTTWPFVRWYVEKYLLTQARHDQYTVAFCGDWVDPGTNGTAGALIESFDGLNFHIKADVASGALAGVIATGALETDDELFVEQMEDFIEQITDKYRGEQLEVNMHDSYFQSFKRGMHLKYNVNYPAQDKSQLAQFYFRSNISVRGHFNMTQTVGGTASEKVWVTPRSNAVKGMRVGGDSAQSFMRVESADYNLKMFNDWHVFYGYYDPRIVWVNDRENS